MLAAGQADSITSVFESEYRRLCRLAYVLTGDRSRAEEIVMEAFVRSMTKWRSVREPSAYVRRAVVNLASNRRRRAFLERALPFRREPITAPAEPVEHVWAAVRRLPPRQRAAVVLRYWGDESDDVDRRDARMLRWHRQVTAIQGPGDVGPRPSGGRMSFDDRLRDELADADSAYDAGPPPVEQLTANVRRRRRVQLALGGGGTAAVVIMVVVALAIAGRDTRPTTELNLAGPPAGSRGDADPVGASTSAVPPSTAGVSSTIGRSGTGYSPPASVVSPGQATTIPTAPKSTTTTAAPTRWRHRHGDTGRQREDLHAPARTASRRLTQRRELDVGPIPTPTTPRSSNEQRCPPIRRRLT